MIIILILLLAVFQASISDYLLHEHQYYELNTYTWETDQFRNMDLGEGVISLEIIDFDWLTTWMIENGYDLTDKRTGKTYDNSGILLRAPQEYRKLRQAYQTILTDLKYFPVPKSSDPQALWVAYENGWGQKRQYGGQRSHEGCDLMAQKQERGYYPVLSMSDGVVEKVGWLEQGGYRLGIRSPGGLYLYYAHLHSYSRQWSAGDSVKAGELIGFMGDTGYSKIEGTTGNFEVHLHVGIYLKTDHYEEMSINPYWILRYLEQRVQTYAY